ncbi:MAG: SH3 domain-containing protein [Candidatus Riflebacteria bacterium]|nr:SH3 domain-containing protein [Candidatus Riflebacteria bacterium]
MMCNRKKILIYSVIFCFIGSLLFADSPFDVKISSDKNKLETESVSSGQSLSEKQIEKETNNQVSNIEGIIKVNTSLRLREYPWGPVIGKYTNNTKCIIIGEEGEFYKVTINGVTGYLHKNYVSTDSKPASRVEPDYPGDCKNGGYIAKNTANSPSNTNTSSNNNKSYTKTTSNVSNNQTSSFVGSSYRSGSSSSYTTINVSNLPVKESVIGQKQGDGTAAGAITWAKDQMAGGTKMGFNKNNGKISQNETCWNYYCGAFIATAWGRKVPQMVGGSAYEQYKNFKRDGMIHTDKNPPAGAIMFTAPTATSKYGHVFMATGEITSNGEPMVITSGWKGHNGISTMPLSQMIGSKQYLGWAMP